MSGALDAILLACAETLARWRRPSAAAWGVVGACALRLGLGAPSLAHRMDVVVEGAAEVDAIVALLHVVASARIASRLGCSVQVRRVTGDASSIDLRVLESDCHVRLRFAAASVIAPGEDLQDRQRWPVAWLQSEAWPGWHVAALVPTPRILLADLIRRVDEGDAASEEGLHWLVARGVVDPDARALAQVSESGRALAIQAGCLVRDVAQPCGHRAPSPTG